MDQTQVNNERFHLSFQRPRIGLAAIIGRLWAGVTMPIWSPAVATADEPIRAVTADQFIAASTPVAIAFMLSVLVLKITAFVLGYLIVRLGHDTLIKGVSGQIDFGFSGSGLRAKLKAASPGALFVLMGAAIILWGLTVQKPMEIKMLPSPQQTAPMGPATGTEKPHRPAVPE
jgi:hypothetical protein